MRKILRRLLAVSGMVIMVACAKQEPVPVDPGNHGSGDGGDDVEAEAPSITWASNPDLATVDINDELDASITISAPGLIKKVTLDIKSDVFAKALREIFGLNKTYLDLTSEEDVISALGDWFAVGNELLGKEEVTIDLTEFVKTINDVTKTDGNHKVQIEVTDQNGKKATMDCMFHRIGVNIPYPSVTWESNPDFAKVDIDEDLDAKIKFSVPGGISEMTMIVESKDALNEEMTDKYSIRSGKIILTDKTNLIAQQYIDEVCGGKIPFGDEVIGKTELEIDLTEYVKRINDLTFVEGDHKITFSITDNENQTSSKDLFFHRVAPASPSIAWASNPDFAKVDIDENLKVDLSVSVPGGISSFVVGIESDILVPLLQSMGMSENLDLINDSKVVSFIKELNPEISVGQDLKNLTSADMDITAMVAIIAELTKEDSDHALHIKVTDNNGKTAEADCIFHRPGEEQGGEIPEPVEGLSITWPGNENFEAVSASSDAMVLHIEAESGIKAFIITVNTEDSFINRYLPAVTMNGDNVLDLINDAEGLRSNLIEGFEFEMLLGDELKDQTSVDFDFSGLVKDFMDRFGADGSTVECVLYVETNDGKSQTVKCIFKL